MTGSFYELSINKINNGKGTVNFADLKGKVVLAVNVASRCGRTKHYTGLEALYKKYASQGLVVIGFPSNEFGAQEPGTEDEIVEFCSRNYDVTFDITEKIQVNGSGAHPVFTYLKTHTNGAEVSWNFEKFLISKDGSAVYRFENVVPEGLEAKINELLAA
ncbi:hypothetical protein HDU79_007952 [Rhizoclosmatium sp. JEL0117]|nr:hypothetical protein HDU79_007952 [Rhizoclosmatium sp. JEL0117]